MAATLEGLPTELVELVVTLLPTKDIKSLRQISQDVAAKSSQGCFEDLFKRKKLLLALPAIELFARMTEAGSMGCSLECLVLIDTLQTSSTIRDRQRTDANEAPSEGTERAPVEETKLEVQRAFGVELVERADELKIPLRRAFSNLRQHSKRKGLASLSLQVHILGPGAAWKPRSLAPMRPDNCPRPDQATIWRKAWRLHDAAFDALRQSRLSVGSLDIFGDVDRCSIALDYFEQGLEKDPESIMWMLKELNGLDLSIANSSQDAHKARTLRAAHRRIKILGGILMPCRNLTSLKLHFYTACEYKPSKQQVAERAFFTDIAPTLNFPHLTHCTLQGIRTSSDVFAKFVTTHTVKHWALEEIHLQGVLSVWRVVFDALVIDADGIEMNDLWADRLLLLPVRMWTRDEHGAINGGRIMFSPMPPQPSCIEVVRWRNERRHKYGPP